MYQTSTEIRVRYGETDQMGFLYYGFYALYYEVGRTEAIRQLGFPYKKMEELGVMLPVVRMSCEYKRPAKYDDLIKVVTTLESMPTESEITFKSELYNTENKLINVGYVTLVFYDMKEKKKCMMPDYLTEKLKPFFS